VPRGVPTGDASYTVSAWFRVDSLSPSKSGIVHWGNWKDRQAFVFVLGRADDHDFAQAYWVNDDSKDLYAQVPTGTIVGSWHHVVTSFDRSTGLRRIYIDGQWIANGGSPDLPNFGDNNFAIGYGWFFGKRKEFFDGWLDEVGIWDRELSEEEIRRLHNDGNGWNPMREAAANQSERERRMRGK
jgi:hypothetical protein